MKRIFAKTLRPRLAELIIRGWLPERVGRYIVLDMLLVWEDGAGV